MAIEALLATNRTFVHKPQHDLESILYIIIYICTFVHGPGILSRHELDVTHHTMSPPMRTWFCKTDIREIGYRKLVHLESYDTQILPFFTSYWGDFAPFVEDLIIACFPVKARLPNAFQYDQALQILTMAYESVEEPKIRTLKQARDSFDRERGHL